jgi:hypothetical protein
MSERQSTRNFSQAGYAIVENRIRGLPITLGFELTKWEAEASMGKLRTKVGNEFYQELQVVCATLTFSVQENGDAELDQLEQIKEEGK